MTQCGRLRDTRRLRTERRPASIEMISSGHHWSINKVVTKLMTFQISDLVIQKIYQLADTLDLNTALTF